MSDPDDSTQYLASSLADHLAWITLGSNIQPERHLPWAVTELTAIGKVVAVSQVWQSSPVGDENQADFCNAAIQLRTQLEPLALKKALRNIEDRLGRVRDPSNKNAARTIDLDIALYDSLVMNRSGLCIPDPDIPDRPFLAVPLAELDGTFLHPVEKRGLNELARTSPGREQLVLRADIRLCSEI